MGVTYRKEKGVVRNSVNGRESGSLYSSNKSDIQRFSRRETDPIRKETISVPTEKEHLV